MTRTSLVAPVLVCGILASTAAAASSVEEFWSEYPAAAERLDQAYSQVHLVAVSRWQKPPYGEVLEEVKCWRSGPFGKLLRTPLNNVVPEWSQGAIYAYVGEGEKWYEVYKPGADQAFQFLFAGVPQSDMEYTRALSLVYPTRFEGTELIEWFRDNTIVEVRRSTLDNTDVVDVCLQVTINGGPAGPDHYYFDPTTWALVGVSLTRGNELPQWRFAYDTSKSVPVIQRREKWTEAFDDPDIRYSASSTEVKSISFGPIPDGEFTLESLGVTERPAITVDTAPAAAANHEHGYGSASLWYWLASFLLAVCAGAIYLVTTKRIAWARKNG